MRPEHDPTSVCRLISGWHSGMRTRFPAARTALSASAEAVVRANKAMRAPVEVQSELHVRSAGLQPVVFGMAVEMKARGQMSSLNSRCLRSPAGGWLGPQRKLCLKAHRLAMAPRLDDSGFFGCSLSRSLRLLG